jgi:hypothetical protein
MAAVLLKEKQRKLKNILICSKKLKKFGTMSLKLRREELL